MIPRSKSTYGYPSALLVNILQCETFIARLSQIRTSRYAYMLTVQQEREKKIRENSFYSMSLRKNCWNTVRRHNVAAGEILFISTPFFAEDEDLPSGKEEDQAHAVSDSFSFFRCRRGRAYIPVSLLLSVIFGGTDLERTLLRNASLFFFSGASGGATAGLAMRLPYIHNLQKL